MVDKVALAHAIPPVLRFSPASITPPMLHTDLQLTYCSYQKDKGAKRGNIPKSCDLSEIGENWIEKFFHCLLPVKG
jgi:hypothetical protein